MANKRKLFRLFPNHFGHSKGIEVLLNVDYLCAGRGSRADGDHQRWSSSSDTWRRVVSTMSYHNRRQIRAGCMSYELVRSWRHSSTTHREPLHLIHCSTPPTRCHSLRLFA